MRGLSDTFCAPHRRRLRQRGCDLAAVRDCCDLVDFDARMVSTFHGYPDLAAAGAKLHRVLPKVISLGLNFAASKRVLAAMKEDVRDEVKRQQELADL